MEENINRKQELESAIKEYLNQAEMRPMSDSRELAQSDDHVVFFGFSSFGMQDDPDSYCFVTPVVAERKLTEKVDSLFNSQVSPATVRSALTTAIRDLDGFPLANDERKQQFSDILFEQLNIHYERQYEAIVPLYQLECADGVEFPLANAVLYSGGQRSLLAGLVKDEAKSLFESDKNRIENRSFLKFPVTGDSHSRLDQVEYEAERALQVLRFTYPWFEEGRPFNPSHGVSTWKHSCDYRL